MQDILTFTNPLSRWLSNMTYVSISYGGLVYPSTENFYQAMKFKEKDTRLLISKLKPHESKSFSKNNPMTSLIFEEKKLEIMEYAQRLKYNKEPFRSKLLATEDVLLEEGNWWGDTFWGVDIKTRQGANHLGKIIMKVRDEIRG